MCNIALAKTFGYQSLKEAEKSLKNGHFIDTHFDPLALGELRNALAHNGEVNKWLMLAKDLHAKELAFELSAKLTAVNKANPTDFIEAYLLPPNTGSDDEALVQKVKHEVELASKAKNEFLSNISHELRTPLNIIIGMLNLAIEDERLPHDLQDNLCLAKQGADNLFTIINDLITLSNLEGRRLVAEMGHFSQELLLNSVELHYAHKAHKKNVSIILEFDKYKDAILDGSYNLIMLALEKIVDNAIKFTSEKSTIIVKAGLIKTGTDYNLSCMVLDDGPGFEDKILSQQNLFIQGDGSINRKHGGLGLGLRLITNIVSKLGGKFTIKNRPQGGAECGFEVPVQYSVINNG